MNRKVLLLLAFLMFCGMQLVYAADIYLIGNNAAIGGGDPKKGYENVEGGAKYNNMWDTFDE